MKKRADQRPEGRLHEQLDRSTQIIKDMTGRSSDIKFRAVRLPAGDRRSLSAVIVFVDGVTRLEPLLYSLMSCEAPDTGRGGSGASEVMEHYRLAVQSEGEVTELGDYDELMESLLYGHSILLIEGCRTALTIGTKDVQARSVEEPNVQSVIRGPREGFVEVLSKNTAMLRRKINNPNLWIETMKIGHETKTTVALVHMNGIADDSILDEVRRKLSGIRTDSVLESNYIEEYLQHEKYSPFPTVFNTERPDVVSAALLEGRVAVMVDGTPFALVVPAVFTQFFQSSEDYYQRTDFATLIRLLRFLCFLLATLTPATYIAISTFHQEMLPTTLLYNLASQREGVPFPAFVEAILMEITFEILREASIRMPKSIGQAISIVGTLVVGQAAVEAGLVSAAMVIVVSITAISNFVLPAFNMGISVRIVRFSLMILAATFGLFGIFLGIIAAVLHLCSLKSVGVPYMSPLAPFHFQEQEDTLIRIPMGRMFRRPLNFHPGRKIRRGPHEPKPEDGRDGDV